MAEVEQIPIGGLDCVSVQAVAGRPSAAAVFCHGFGAPGTDLVPLAGELFAQGGKPVGRVRFLFPAAPIELDPEWDARCWWPINMERMQMALAAGQLSALADFVPAELSRCREQLHGLVDWCRQQDGLEPGQIVLGGFSQGAMLAVDAALSLAAPPGGLCVWSGMVINQSEWRQRLEQCPPFPVVQSHGTLDPILPFVCGEQLREMLMGAGLPVEFIRFAGQHQIPGEAIRAAARLLAGVALSASEGKGSAMGEAGA